MAKETVEEIAHNKWGNIHRTGVLGFIEGANWQAERSYTEEELYNIITKILNALHPDFRDSTKKQMVDSLFEQFKK